MTASDSAAAWRHATVMDIAYPAWRMRRLAFSALFLAACGSSATPSSTTVDITQNGTVETVSQPGSYTLDISGDSDQITLAASQVVSAIEISGTSNLLTIGTNESITTITVEGLDNTIEIPVGSHFAITDNGTGTQVLTYTPE